MYIGTGTHHNAIDLTVVIDFINNGIVAVDSYTYTHSDSIYKETPLRTSLNTHSSDSYSSNSYSEDSYSGKSLYTLYTHGTYAVTH